MKKGERKKGFSIMEVVLVLAIAGLIFLMVFVALPALKRNSSDARRRDDMARLVMAIKKYQSNNRGALPSGNANKLTWNSSWSDTNKPTGWGDLYYAYLGQDFTDPDGSNYAITALDCTGNTGVACTNTAIKNLVKATFPNEHIVYVVRSATCDGVTARKSNNKRKVAVLYKLEGAEAYCTNS